MISKSVLKELKEALETLTEQQWKVFPITCEQMLSLINSYEEMEKERDELRRELGKDAHGVEACPTHPPTILGQKRTLPIKG